MGKRRYFTHVALILGLAVLVPQCVCKPQSWSLPKLQLPQTPIFSPRQLPIDCAELTADSSIPEFLIKELCSPPPAESTTETVVEANGQEEAVEAQDQEGAAENKDQEGAAEVEDQERAAETKDQEEAVEAEDQEGAAETKDQEGAAGTKDQEGAAEAKNHERAAKINGQEETENGAQEPSQVIVPFFRVVIQKLVSAGAKVPTKEFWLQAYHEAGAPKLSRHPTIFEMVVGFQHAVDSFRSEDSWWDVVRLIKDLTSDKHWKRLEAAVVAAHGRDSGNLWKALGAVKALKVVLKSSIAEPECRVQGLNPDLEDCRRYHFCYHFHSRWKSTDIKCPKYTEFSPSKLRCVWAPISDCVEQPDSGSDEDSDSDESSDSGESSREVVERILKHGSGAFHVQ